MSKLRKLMNKRIWAYGLFWSWNIIFLAFMLLGFAPTVLPEMITAVNSQVIPTIFLLYAAILTLIPIIAVVLGFTILRREPEKLFALGYGVEGPLMLILAIRFFVIRQTTTAVAFILITAGLGILTYLWHLLDKKISKRSAPLTHVRQIGLTLLLVAGLYAGIWIAFYALPAGVQGIRTAGEFFEEIWRSIREIDWAMIEWRWVPFAVLGTVLFVYTGTLFVLMPIAVTILYARAWWQGLRDFNNGFGRARAAVITTAVFALIAILFVTTNRQPQHKAFALLDEMPTSLAQAKALQDEDDAIRTGLLNAYLAPQRYL
ncbi:MAG: hypothetical protein GY943_29860, partial [Chloroflexi bacterium]|nr:hypothetical protein [Chloroflexota bacterium]